MGLRQPLKPTHYGKVRGVSYTAGDFWNDGSTILECDKASLVLDGRKSIMTGQEVSLAGRGWAGDWYVDVGGKKYLVLF